MEPDQSFEGLDVDRPSPARMYDYYLGGSYNFAADRDAANKVLSLMPDAPLVAQANRAFLRRVVRYCVDSGIRQFLDIGSGIPTAGNVHEIAQQIAPDCRIAYVDTDPIAVTHSKQILDGNAGAVAILEDVRQPRSILDHPEVRALLDFDQPFAILLAAVLHFIPDEDKPGEIVAELRSAMTPGSYLAISHGTAEGREQQAAAVGEVYRKSGSAGAARSRTEVSSWFDGLTMVSPGVVWVTQWRPESSDGEALAPERSSIIGGLGFKD